MGCDIHMAVEVDKYGGRHNQPWTWRPITPICWACKGEQSDCPQCRGAGVSVLDDRNYCLFAALADVRNGTWGVTATPISAPRGLPEDCSIRDDAWVFGDHSESWLSLAELLAYNWDAPVTYDAVVSWEAWRALKERGERPQSFCASSSNEIAEETAVAIMGTKTEGSYPGVRTSWASTLREAVGPRWFAFMDGLKRLGSPEAVRIVFGFDN